MLAVIAHESAGPIRSEAVAGDGDAARTVWILADGLRSIPTVSMAWPPLLDVAALLEAAVPLRE